MKPSIGILVVIAFMVGGAIAGQGGPPEFMGLAVFFGILFAFGVGMPWLFCAYAHRYDDMFNRLAVQNEF